MTFPTSSNPWESRSTSKDMPSARQTLRNEVLNELAHHKFLRSAKAAVSMAEARGLVKRAKIKARRITLAGRQDGGGDEQSGKRERPTMAFLA
jgi:hypothetical protein